MRGPASRLGICVLVAALWYLASGAVDEDPLTRYYLTEVDAAAVCNDGSPALYFHRPGLGTNATRWVIRFQGGAWCWDGESCEARMLRTPYLMSSNLVPASTWMFAHAEGIPDVVLRPDGILSRDPERNPLFFTWSHVYIWYCSSDSHLGDAPAGLPETGPWQFRGKRIVGALVQHLLDYHRLGDAKQLLVTGDSAGGVAALNNAAFIQSRLRYNAPQLQRFKAFIDAGWFVDIPSYSPVPDAFNFRMVAQSLQTKWNASFDSSCTEFYGQAESWRCFHAQYAARHVPVPLMFHQYVYDSANLGYDQASYPNFSDFRRQFLSSISHDGLHFFPIVRPAPPLASKPPALVAPAPGLSRVTQDRLRGPNRDETQLPPADPVDGSQKGGWDSSSGKGTRDGTYPAQQRGGSGSSGQDVPLLSAQLNLPGLSGAIQVSRGAPEIAALPRETGHGEPTGGDGAGEVHAIPLDDATPAGRAAKPVDKRDDDEETVRRAELTGQLDDAMRGGKGAEKLSVAENPLPMSPSTPPALAYSSAAGRAFPGSPPLPVRSQAPARPLPSLPSPVPLPASPTAPASAVSASPTGQVPQDPPGLPILSPTPDPFSAWASPALRRTTPAENAYPAQGSGGLARDLGRALEGNPLVGTLMDLPMLKPLFRTLLAAEELNGSLPVVMPAAGSSAGRPGRRDRVQAVRETGEEPRSWGLTNSTGQRVPGGARWARDPAKTLNVRVSGEERASRGLPNLMGLTVSSRERWSRGPVKSIRVRVSGLERWAHGPLKPGDLRVSGHESRNRVPLNPTGHGVFADEPGSLMPVGPNAVRVSGDESQNRASVKAIDSGVSGNKLPARGLVNSTPLGVSGSEVGRQRVPKPHDSGFRGMTSVAQADHRRALAEGGLEVRHPVRRMGSRTFTGDQSERYETVADPPTGDADHPFGMFAPACHLHEIIDSDLFAFSHVGDVRLQTVLGAWFWEGGPNAWVIDMHKGVLPPAQCEPLGEPLAEGSLAGPPDSASLLVDRLWRDAMLGTPV
eukprot:jgi/Botrbrau1/6996/Bobra.0165s0026.1